MHKIMFVLTTVGYTMDTVFFSFLEDYPMQVDPVAIIDENIQLDSHSERDCSMNYTAGTVISQFFLLFTAHLKLLVFQLFVLEVDSTKYLCSENIESFYFEYSAIAQHSRC